MGQINHHDLTGCNHSIIDGLFVWNEANYLGLSVGGGREWARHRFTFVDIHPNHQMILWQVMISTSA